MRFENKSKWDTQDILKLLRRCFEQAGADIREYHIKIINAKSLGVHGLGSYVSKWIRLSLPTRAYVSGSGGESVLNDLSEITGNLAVKMAQVGGHEINHTQGLHHKDMVNWTSIDCEWARDFVIHMKAEKPKLTTDGITRTRYEHVLELIKKNEARQKRSKTALTKLYARKRYYEKKREAT